MSERWAYVLLLVGCCGLAGAQTQVGLRNQAKNADLSAVGPTKPMQTGAALTPTCGTGEMFFLTTAAAGSNLYTCAAPNVWTQVVSLASVTQGTGTIVTTSGSMVTVAVDPAQIPTRTAVQASTSNIVTLTSSSSTALTGTMNPTLGAYSDKQLVEFTWNLACTPGAITLAIDGLAATNLYEADGATALKASDCASGQGTGGAGQTNVFVYDGAHAVFKLVGGGMSSMVTLPASAHVIGSNASGQAVAATASDISAIKYVAGGGTANAQTATYAPAITALSAGLNACWLPTAANTSTTPTFAPNGLAAKTIVKAGGAALAGGDLTTTAIACAIYDGTNWELQNSQTTSGGSGLPTYATTCVLTTTWCLFEDWNGNEMNGGSVNPWFTSSAYNFAATTGMVGAMTYSTTSDANVQWYDGHNSTHVAVAALTTNVSDTRWRAKANGATSIYTFVGWTDNSSANVPGNSVGIAMCQNDFCPGGFANADWYCVARTGGGTYPTGWTMTDTGVAADANTHVFEVTTNGSGSMTCTIDGAHATTLSSGMPTAAISPGKTLGSNSGTTSYSEDYFYAQITGLTR